MRRLKGLGRLLVNILVNMLLDPKGAIPAGITLALHFLAELPLWWTAAAVGLWALGIVLRMAFVRWASHWWEDTNPQKPEKKLTAGKSGAKNVK